MNIARSGPWSDLILTLIALESPMRKFVRFLQDLVRSPTSTRLTDLGVATGNPGSQPVDVTEEEFLADPQRFLGLSRGDHQVFVKDGRGNVRLILGTSGMKWDVDEEEDDEFELPLDHSDRDEEALTSWLD